MGNQFSSVQFSRSVVSDSLRPHESQHALMAESEEEWGILLVNFVDGILVYYEHFLFFSPPIFIYLATPGLSCRSLIFDLCCSMQDLYLLHANS